MLTQTILEMLNIRTNFPTVTRYHQDPIKDHERYANNQNKIIK